MRLYMDHYVIWARLFLTKKNIYCTSDEKISTPRNNLKKSELNSFISVVV